MGIKIREWRLEDKKGLSENLSNTRVMDNLRDGLPYPYTEKDAEDYITAMMNADRNSSWSFAITLDDQVIGNIGVYRCENIHSLTAEMGYYIGEPYWGKGYMTEAVRQTCEYVFENSDIVRIFAEPFADNPDVAVIEHGYSSMAASISSVTSRLWNTFCTSSSSSNASASFRTLTADSRSSVLVSSGMR